MNHTRQISPGNSADVTHRHPKLREVNGLPRFKKAISLLITEQSRLNFNIGAFVIGKRFAPVKAIRISAPRPYLFSRELGIVRKVHSSRVGMWVPHTHKRFAASVHK